MSLNLKKRWLFEQYNILKLSTHTIAKKINCDPSTIRKNLIKYNIPLRTYVEANSGHRNPFYGRKHSEATRMKMSINHADVSGEKHPGWGIPNPGASKRFSGKNNPKWKGGISSLNILIRGSKKYKLWRRKVYERDLFTCRRCNKPNTGNLNAHHLYGFAAIVSEEMIKTVSQANNCIRLWDIKNGITLCKKCHKEEHII